MDQEPGTRKAFEDAVVTGGGGEQAEAAAHDLRSGDLETRFRVAELMVHVAAVAPERLVDVYDGLTAGWYGTAPKADPVSAPASDGEVPDSFWEAFWALVDDPDAGRDPADITVRTVALTSLVSVDLPSRVATMAARYPGVRSAAAGGLPGRFQLVDLERCPPESLGGHLYKLVVEGGFDLEVLDRDSLGLAEMPAPLDYVNLRILQCHDVWHKVAGYETTGLHEVAISGFQMGQFGHHYSSMFLALVVAKASFSELQEGAGFLLDTILSAYRHGR